MQAVDAFVFPVLFPDPNVSEPETPPEVYSSTSS